MMHLLFAAWAKSCSRSILNALSKKGSVLRVAKKEKSLRILGHPKFLRSLLLDSNSLGKWTRSKSKVTRSTQNLTRLTKNLTHSTHNLTCSTQNLTHSTKNLTRSTFFSRAHLARVYPHRSKQVCHTTTETPIMKRFPPSSPLAPAQD